MTDENTWPLCKSEHKILFLWARWRHTEDRS